MDYPEYEAIARAAYRRWEERGRPDGQDVACWLDAETELQRQVWALAVPDTGPPMNNLDRALSPEDRRRARAERQGGEERMAAVQPDGRQHFVVVLGRGHLRIYERKGDSPPARAQFELAEAFDLPAARTGQRGTIREGAVDERLPLAAEQDRRLVAELASYVARFLAEHAEAAWDYAAGPALYHAVLDRLPSAIRARLAVALVKELVHQSPATLRMHFGLTS